MRASICGLLASPPPGPRGWGCIVYDTARGLVEEVAEEPRGKLVAAGEDLLVLPGLVDMHVHLRGLRLSYKEDERSGCRAALRGGLTLVADMPNTSPPASTPEAVAEKLRRLRSLRLEALLYAGVPPREGLVDEIASMPGVAGFKIYPRDLEERHRVVEYILSKPGLLVVIHPELPEAEKSEYEDPSSRAAGRGCHWEAAAVEYIASLSPEARVHVTHASCSSTVTLAKRHGFTVDVAPHHLLYTPPRGGGCLYKVNPPLRHPPEPQLLLKQLLDGQVDAIASDHAPHAPREKEGDPLTCPPGIAWLEAWPRLILCLLDRLGGPQLLASLASARPAALLSRRRCLDPGCPATFTVYQRGWTRFDAVRESKARRVPYLGSRLCAETRLVVVNGEVLMLG